MPTAGAAPAARPDVILPPPRTLGDAESVAYHRCMGRADRIDSFDFKPGRLLAGKYKVEALLGSGTVVEYHEYDSLGHGFGLGTGTSAEGWVLEANRFWERSIRR